MERNNSTLGSVMMVEWSTRKREMGDVGGNNVEDRSGYEKSGGTTCRVWLGTHHIGITTCQIGTCTCSIRGGQLTRTRNSLKSQFLRIISPITSHLTLSRSQIH